MTLKNLKKKSCIKNPQKKSNPGTHKSFIFIPDSSPHLPVGGICQNCNGCHESLSQLLDLEAVDIHCLGVEVSECRPCFCDIF